MGRPPGRAHRGGGLAALPAAAPPAAANVPRAHERPGAGWAAARIADPPANESGRVPGAAAHADARADACAGGAPAAAGRAAAGRAAAAAAAATAAAATGPAAAGPAGRRRGGLGGAGGGRLGRDGGQVRRPCREEGEPAGHACPDGQFVRDLREPRLQPEHRRRRGGVSDPQPAAGGDQALRAAEGAARAASAGAAGGHGGPPGPGRAGRGAGGAAAQGGRGRHQQGGAAPGREPEAGGPAPPVAGGARRGGAALPGARRPGPEQQQTKRQ